MTIEELREELDAVLNIKLEEFHFLGYELVTKEDIWEYLITNKWNKMDEVPQKYQLVNDVLVLSPSDYVQTALREVPDTPEFFFKRFSEVEME